MFSDLSARIKTDLSITMIKELSVVGICIVSDYAKIVDTGVVSLNVLSQMPEEHASNKDDRHDGLKKGKTEIRLSCDIFNLYTCVDSLKVLSEVLQYIAANGDVTNNVGGSTSSNAGDSSQTCSTNAVEHDVTQVPEDRSARGDVSSCFTVAS